MARRKWPPTEAALLSIGNVFDNYFREFHKLPKLGVFLDQRTYTHVPMSFRRGNCVV